MFSKDVHLAIDGESITSTEVLLVTTDKQLLSLSETHALRARRVKDRANEGRNGWYSGRDADYLSSTIGKVGNFSMVPSSLRRLVPWCRVEILSRRGLLDP